MVGAARRPRGRRRSRGQRAPPGGAERSPSRSHLEPGRGSGSSGEAEIAAAAAAASPGSTGGEPAPRRRRRRQRQSKRGGAEGQPGRELRARPGSARQSRGASRLRVLFFL
ncbi:putative uncharacterized protein encoded by MAPKAPK5-AS1 [Melospiza georgiana]|uniref:putative uncharacterized protein encoded by MAPKAPK5-AS1 n=1 Tax=Melospiza georgiana TaxID=44398 RepID=UPI0025ACD387|nr:putative uncharacterized protein encoded by MAPKAPK5-AS1 [Melospiza georgiana]